MFMKVRRLAMTVALLVGILSVSAQQTYKLRKWDISPGQYSGITPLGNDLYAVVTDAMQGAGFLVWRISINQETGGLLNVEEVGRRVTPWTPDRDQEGVAYCPPRNSVFISGEADQRILEHRLDGTLTGAELAIPEKASVGNIQDNRGFEALCYDGLRQCFWTTTESSLRADSAGFLRFLTFNPDSQFQHEYHYTLEAPQAKNFGRNHYHGVVSVCALADGTLLVLEREARIARRYSGSRCWCRLFRFEPDTREKTEVMGWSTRFTPFNTRFANYEGMCLGPTLSDGRQTVLFISDSEGGYGRGPWRLRDRLKVVVL